MRTPCFSVHEEPAVAGESHRLVNIAYSSARALAITGGGGKASGICQILQPRISCFEIESISCFEIEKRCGKPRSRARFLIAHRDAQALVAGAPVGSGRTETSAPVEEHPR